MSSLMFLIILVLNAFEKNVGEVTDNEAGIISQVAGISHRQCKDECRSNTFCQAARYHRLLKLCKQFVHLDSLENKHGGIYTYWNPDFLEEYHEQNTTGQTHVDDFAFDHNSIPCYLPQSTDEFVVLGNLQNVGSKIRFDCLDGSKTKISSCHLDGTWSVDNLTCACPFSQLNVASFHVVSYNESHSMAEFTCNDSVDAGYVEKETAYCDYYIGVWVSDAQANNENEWILVYSLEETYGFLKVQKSWYNQTYADSKTGVNRNVIIDHWNDIAISEVKVELIKDNQSSAFMVFDGKGTGYKTWFSKNHLLETSLVDNETDLVDIGTDFFSISGPRNSNYSRRFFISEQHSDSLPSICETDQYWMVLMHHNDLPCITNDGKSTMILYAPGETSTTLGNMEHADYFKVSVNMKTNSKLCA